MADEQCKALEVEDDRPPATPSRTAGACRRVRRRPAAFPAGFGPSLLEIKFPIFWAFFHNFSSTENIISVISIILFIILRPLVMEIGLGKLTTSN